tara:strand:+ start:1283 stop:2044 length:762 start_codon:yes stop_codon:yes gene_type:complete
MKRPILALIIPIYFEEKNIESLFTMIESYIKIPVKIYFIYDSIDDPTITEIKNQEKRFKSSIELLQNKYGSGALNAIKTGFESFSEEACVVIMADGSDDLSTINGMYGLFCQGFHIVCGSRYMRNGKQIGGHWFKKTLSSLAGKSLYWLTKIPTHDVTNSFKLYTREVLNNITFESTGGFEIGMEIVVKAHLMNYAISEVPSIWNDRYEGTSKFRLWAWLPKYIKWYLFLIFKSIKLNSRADVDYNQIRPVGY